MVMMVYSGRAPGALSISITGGGKEGRTAKQSSGGGRALTDADGRRGPILRLIADRAYDTNLFRNLLAERESRG
jgi:hypothetical protein